MNRIILTFLVAASCLQCTDNLKVRGQEQLGQPAITLPATDEGLPGVGPIRRYPWFQELWTKKRTGWATRVQQDQGAVVFLGDSITQGWNDDFRGQFTGVKLANRGISGDTTRGMLIRLADDVLALNPQVVVFLGGTNDLEEKAQPEEVAANFREIISLLKKHDSEMPIVVCEVFPSAASKKRPRAKITQVNELLRKAVRGDSQVIVLDTWTLFADADGDANAEEFPDLLHPNAAGYVKWANALKPIFATLGLIETQSDDFAIEEGFTSLFNGDDLTGWCVLPSTEAQIQQGKRMEARNKDALAWPIFKQRVELAGQKASPDGRYRAIHGRLVVTTPSEGRRIQQLWTTSEFNDDFTLKLEFRATPNADSGVFLRGKQLQCRDFPLAGPYKELEQFRQSDWNELEVIVRGNQARCTCNGELLEEALELPESGRIGLEGDRGQMEYRRIRISTAAPR